ncbi:hypothetical protein RRG08_041305 [Elysia crispata]|uniref:Uncharacterized protein n=1 Tax=Elysia crispata TaxID=231223 RepID=A0AAE0ZTU6_9GAST|nr:hypothetical protein RRG08_041305 [Elysia crispata]
MRLIVSRCIILTRTCFTVWVAEDVKYGEFVEIYMLYERRYISSSFNLQVLLAGYKFYDCLIQPGFGKNVKESKQTQRMRNADDEFYVVIYVSTAYMLVGCISCSFSNPPSATNPHL